MNQKTVTELAVLVFALIFVSFIIRGFGQFVVGPRTATVVAGPVAVLAFGVLLLVMAIWGAARIGIISIEQEENH